MVNQRHTLTASPCLLELLRTTQHSVQLRLSMPAKEALLLYTDGSAQCAGFTSCACPCLCPCECPCP